MCFYIFSEETNLHIKYLSEIVSYKYFGRPQVSAELLVENASDCPLTHFHIVYPNHFLMERRAYSASGEEALTLRQRDSEFRDESASWQSYSDRPSADALLCYETSNFKVEYPVHDGKEYRSLAFPRDENPMTHGSTIEGLIGGKCKMKIEEHVGLTGISHEAGFTLFRVDLDEPYSNNSRWFRFSFEPMYSSLRKSRTIRHCIYLMMLNEYYHSYEISGPLEIRRRYLERIRILLEEPGNKDREMFLPRIRDFLGHMEGHKVESDRLHLHLWPRGLHVLFNFLPIGNIAIKGDFPRILDTTAMRARLHDRRVYSLESTPDSNRNAPWIEDFRVFFSGQTHMRGIEFAPVAAVLMLMSCFVLVLSEHIIAPARDYLANYVDAVPWFLYFIGWTTVLAFLRAIYIKQKKKLF